MSGLVVFVGCYVLLMSSLFFLAQCWIDELLDCAEDGERG